jgi:hypothetical protein
MHQEHAPRACTKSMHQEQAPKEQAPTPHSCDAAQAASTAAQVQDDKQHSTPRTTPWPTKRSSQGTLHPHTHSLLLSPPPPSVRSQSASRQCGVHHPDAAPGHRDTRQAAQPTFVRCQICFSSAPRLACPMASTSAQKLGSASMGTWPMISCTTSGSGVYMGLLGWRMYCVEWKYLGAR